MEEALRHDNYECTEKNRFTCSKQAHRLVLINLASFLEKKLFRYLAKYHQSRCWPYYRKSEKILNVIVNNCARSLLTVNA